MTGAKRPVISHKRTPVERDAEQVAGTRASGVYLVVIKTLNRECVIETYCFLSDEGDNADLITRVCRSDG